MEDKDSMAARFRELKEKSLRPNARLWGSGLWESWHDLAVARYEPAYGFFLERLGDERPAWRQASLSLLGFHFVLDEGALSAVRKAAENDPDSGVRASAAAVLGSQGKFPEPALVKILDSDINPLAREAAYSALLGLAGLNFDEVQHELKRLETGSLPLGVSDLVRALQERDLRGPLSALRKSLGRNS